MNDTSKKIIVKDSCTAEVGIVQYEQWDLLEAVFQPRRTDDLRRNAADFIDQTIIVQLNWVIECGPYAGQWACGLSWEHARREQAGLPLPKFVWVPMEDLTVIRKLDDYERNALNEQLWSRGRTK